METLSGNFGRPRTEQELTAVNDIMMQSYAMSPADAASWMQRFDARQELRLWREGGHVAATLVAIPMGQWYGGRSVPIVGVGGVGVAPVHRGKGAATRMMQSFLREVRDSGVSLSALYPSTQPLYRRVGYEQAGARYEVRLEIPHLDTGDRALALRAVEARDEAAVTACYQSFAPWRHGWLDRGPYAWNRVRAPRGNVATGYVVEGASGLEGYLYVVRKQLTPLTQELVLSDFVANTPAAGRRLLRFLADHHSLAHEAVWYGGPGDPLLFLLREQSYQVKLDMHWMVRVLDVAAALEARGWTPGVSGALHLDVEDDLFPENGGRYVLDVSEGAARVRRGGEGHLRMHVRTLAPLYTGFLSAEALRTVGALEGDDASVRTATVLFSGPQPSMRDMF